MTNLIEYPEYRILKEEVHALRKELSQVIFEHDDLKYTICENIKNEYLLEFGNLEYRDYELYCEYLRLRRKKDLIQAKVNRQEEPDLETIERQLDVEFIEYQKILYERLSEIDDAIAWSLTPLFSPEEELEFKTIYRRLIKALHPDLNPNLSDREKELFYRVVEAYKSGDFRVMKILDAMVEDQREDEFATDSISKLKDEKERLTGLIYEIRLEINLIKATTPYIWKDILTDERAKQQKRQELNARINSRLAAIQTQEELIRKLMERRNEQ